MSIRKRDVHFSDWTKVRHALVCNNVQGITETSSFDDVRAFLINSESGSNPFYYYVCYIKETKEIYTHGQFYAYSDSSYDDTELRNLIETKADLSALEALVSEVAENELVTTKALYDLNDRKLDKSELDNIDLSNYVDLGKYNSDLDSINASITNKANQSDLEALSAEVEENEEVTAAALTDLHENKADKSEIPDVSTFATNTDLNTKQDLLVSGTNIKTVNGGSILGSGDIEIHDTKVTSAANHYGYDSNNATSTTGAFVTKITKDAANHVTSFESRALTSTDIPGLDASKITSGTIDIARLPKGALEQLHHYETKELAQQAVIDKAVQLGDTVQINHATMYICTNDSATTFATQFTEYVAGTAASVPWSGITGKPTGIDEWGNRIGVIESGYATQSWVGENYLSLSGGTMTGSITTRSNVYSWTNAKSVGHIIAGNNAGGNAAPIISAGLESGGYGKLAQVSDQFGLYAYSASDSTPSVRFALYPEDGAIKIMGNTLPVSTTTYNLGSASAKWSNVYATSFIGNLTGNADSATKMSSFSVAPDSDDTYRYVWMSWSDNSGKPAYSSKLRFSNKTGILLADEFKGKFTGNADSATKVNTYATSAALHYPLLFGASADSGATMATGLSSIYKNGVNNVYFIPSESRLVAPTISATSFIGDLTGTASGNLPLTGGTMTGPLEIKSENWGRQLNLNRLNNGDNYGPCIRFYADDSGLGAITMGDNELYVCDVAGNSRTAVSKVGHTHNYAGSSTAGGSATKVVCSAATSNSDRPIVVTNESNALYYTTKVKLNYSTGNVTAPTFTGDTANIGTLQIITNEINGANGTGNAHINYSSTGKVTIANGGGDVAIGGTTADEKLHIHGNVKASGNMYATDFCTTSDNRLKDFTKDVIVDFNELKNIPKKYYYWKDKSMGEELQIGTSAQELAKVYPECVSYNEKEDRYSVNYQKLSIIALAAIDKLHERISALEKKLNDQNS